MYFFMGGGEGGAPNPITLPDMHMCMRGNK